MRTFTNRGKPHIVRPIEHERGWVGVLEADSLTEVCGQLLVAHERLVRGEQIGRILEEAANPRLPRRVVVDEETVCRAAVIELLELVANALRRFDVLTR